MKLSIEQKRTLWAEAGKFCLDIAKLIFGGIILASILKKDIDIAIMLCFGALVTLLFAGSGCCMGVHGFPQDESVARVYELLQ